MRAVEDQSAPIPEEILSDLRRIISGYSLWPCWTASLSIYGAVRFVSQAYRPSIYLRRKEVSATCYPTSFALTRS